MKIGILADIHVGSAFGPWPPEAELSAGGKHKPNVGQEYLNENWYRIAAEIPALDVLILNGDVIGGQEPHDRGRYTIDADPQFQARAAYMLLEPFLAKAPVRYCVEGTEYHEGESSTWGEWLAEEIKAIPKDGHFAWDWLLLEVGGLKIDVAHKQSFFQRYPTSALERETQFSDMIGEEADVIVRSHCHRYAYIEVPGAGKIQTAVSTPSWQLQGHFSRTSYSPNRLGPMPLGMIVLEIDHGEASHRRFLFQHPPLRRSVYVTA